MDLYIPIHLNSGVIYDVILRLLNNKTMIKQQKTHVISDVKSHVFLLANGLLAPLK